MKNNKGKKLIALLLAALVVSSSSALVYAADTDTDNESYTISSFTDSQNVSIKWLQADLTTPSMVSNYVSDSVIISQADETYNIVITLNENAVSLISAVKNPDGTDAEKINDYQYIISVSSLEEVIPVGFTVSVMGSTQTAYMVIDDSEDDTVIDVDELAAGTYSLSVKAITESTYGGENPSEFNLSRQFDSNIKLIVSDNRNWSTGETTRSAKIALLYKPSSIDMQKLAVDNVTGTKREFGVAEAGTAYEFVMDIADLENDHKLSFSYDTGIPSLGDNGVMTHSVYLTDYAVDEWNGYDWTSDQLPDDGEYSLSVKAITESTYGTENESEFALERQFDPQIKLNVEDGHMTLSLLYKPSSIDMIKLAIDDTTGTKTAYGSDENGTAYEFTMPITDLTKDRKLSFTYDTGRFVMTHSVYLTDIQIGKWNGYDWKSEETNIELTNTTTIDSDTIALGTRLTVNMSAEGGAGDYTYAVMYRKMNGTNWVVAQDYKDNTAVHIKPAKATQYIICVKAKDADGTVVKKYFTVDVKDTITDDEGALKNTSTIPEQTIKLGDRMTINVSSEDGSGDHTYAVYYRKLAGTKWVRRQYFSTNTDVSIKPAKATQYLVCVKVKDDSGVVEKKYFVVNVEE